MVGSVYFPLGDAVHRATLGAPVEPLPDSGLGWRAAATAATAGQGRAVAEPFTVHRPSLEPPLEHGAMEHGARARAACCVEHGCPADGQWVGCPWVDGWMDGCRPDWMEHVHGNGCPPGTQGGEVCRCRFGVKQQPSPSACAGGTLLYTVPNLPRFELFARPRPRSGSRTSAPEVHPVHPAAAVAGRSVVVPAIAVAASAAACHLLRSQVAVQSPASRPLLSRASPGHRSTPLDMRLPNRNSAVHNEQTSRPVPSPSPVLQPSQRCGWIQPGQWPAVGPFCSASGCTPKSSARARSTTNLANFTYLPTLPPAVQAPAAPCPGARPGVPPS